MQTILVEPPTAQSRCWITTIHQKGEFQFDSIPKRCEYPWLSVTREARAVARVLSPLILCNSRKSLPNWCPHLAGMPVTSVSHSPIKPDGCSKSWKKKNQFVQMNSCWALFLANSKQFSLGAFVLIKRKHLQRRRRRRLLPNNEFGQVNYWPTFPAKCRPTGNRGTVLNDGASASTLDSLLQQQFKDLYAICMQIKLVRPLLEGFGKGGLCVGGWVEIVPRLTALWLRFIIFGDCAGHKL